MADVSHPCPFPEAVLDIFGQRLPRQGMVLDPYGGIGRVHALSHAGRTTVSHEIEEEWYLRTIDDWIADQPLHLDCAWRLAHHGDSRQLPFDDDTFDAVATSPDFGNRMADAYDGERCIQCNATGYVEEARKTVTAGGATIVDDPVQCGECLGSGRKVRSRRYTYRLSLGRRLSEGNGAGKQWGRQYRAIHEKVIAEFMRVLKPGGMVLLDIKNHRRGGGEQKVMEWWIDEIAKHGGVKVSAHLVDTKGLPMSGPDTNDLREWVLEFRKAG